jgi:hypothetical protein
MKEEIANILEVELNVGSNENLETVISTFPKCKPYFGLFNIRNGCNSP